MAEPTDGELVDRTREGDRDAYSSLVARYQGHVYGLAYSLAGNWADAQDIAQETFIRAYVNLDQLRDPARFAPWLRRVTFGVAMNWLKAFRPGFFRQIEGQVDLDSLEIPDFAPGPTDVVEKRELADAVQRAIASLPPKYRVPLTMFHLDGLSYRKVAQFLDIPLGTVQSLIHRARAKLRVALAAYAAEGVSPMVQEVFNEHKLPPEFSREVWNLEYDVRGFSDLLALRACLTQAGTAVDWDDLLGYSGDAFSCDGMSYFSLRGHDVLTGAARSYGFEGRWRFGIEKAHEDLLASLAKKQPCITAGFDGRCLWWVVVLGERAEQNQFLIAGAGPEPQWIAAPTKDGTELHWTGQCPWGEGARTYPDGTPENWQPCPRFLLGGRGEPLPPAARFQGALELALTSHRREGFAFHFGGGERETQPVGRGYLTQWPSLLRGWSQMAKREPLDDCDPDPAPWYRNAYFAPVAHSMRRKAAAAFLRAHASELPDKARPYLESAAKHYDRSPAAADKMFDSLCSAECVQGLDWYRRLQVGPSYLGERDGKGVAAAAAFAKQHPERWAARQAILRHMHKSLQDAGKVEEARRAAVDILRHDDAAIAGIEQALVAIS